MKDLSFFLLKNSLGSKMRRGIRSFCNGDASTSTLNQGRHHNNIATPLDDHRQYHGDGDGDDDIGESSLMISSTTTTLDAETPRPSTLEEMILQLEVEEEIARKARLHYYGDQLMTQQHQQRRMSCVNNSDILRSARNAALNQYPRFSLDGKDAMYRSSFRNHMAPPGHGHGPGHGPGPGPAGRKSVCCTNRGGGGGGLVRGRRSCNNDHQFDDDHDHDRYSSFKLEKRTTTSSRSCLPSSSTTTLPGTGESTVIWCKPGVVAKLMGLDLMPLPPVSIRTNNNNNRSSSSHMKHSNINHVNSNRRLNLRRRAQNQIFMHDYDQITESCQRRRFVNMDMHMHMHMNGTYGCGTTAIKRQGSTRPRPPSSSKIGAALPYCSLIRPLAVLQPEPATNIDY